MLKKIIPFIGLAVLAAVPVHASDEAVEELVWLGDFDNHTPSGTTSPVGPDMFSIAAGGASNSAPQGLPGFDARDLRGPSGGPESFQATGLDAHLNPPDALRPTFDPAMLGNRDRPDDRSWGIDNIRLLASAVPEPDIWGMLIAGFALVGMAVRRRRNVIVIA